MRVVITKLNSLLYFFPIIRHNISCRKKLLLPLYKKKNNTLPLYHSDSKRKIVYMVINETTFSGGLSDRFRAMCAIYNECKKKGLDFRINFETPQLNLFLVPNSYNWYISKDQICYDTATTYPCTLLTYHHSMNDKFQKFAQRTILKYYLSKPYNQIHIYSNMVGDNDLYSELFHELFKPTHELQSYIDAHIENLGGKKNYIAVVFRFRQLLGDFKEGGETLSAKERDTYINRCMKTIKLLHEEMADKHILVTSDSITFLNTISSLPYVYVIPGNVVHIGFTFDAEKKTYMKSFVDYFVLSYASKVYLVRDKKMYHSGFALRAALLNKAEYKEIKLK